MIFQQTRTFRQPVLTAIQITGNIVNGRIIAGQMGVSQLSLQASQG